MTRRSANCPAPDCGFTDVPSLVAAHVNGTEGPEHDWQRLPYDGPGAFLSAARAGEVDDGDGVHNAPEPDDDAANGGGDEGDVDLDGDAVNVDRDAANVDRDAVNIDGDAANVDGDAMNADEDETERVIDPDPLLRAVEVARDRAADVDDLADLDESELADLFVAFSVVAGRARNVRGDVRAAILDRVDDEREIGGTLGSVNRSTSTRRSLRDEKTVRSALFRAGIDPREVTSFDPDLVVEAIAESNADAGITETDVFETSESDHVRRASVNESAFDDREYPSTVDNSNHENEAESETRSGSRRDAGDGR